MTARARNVARGEFIKETACEIGFGHAPTKTQTLASQVFSHLRAFLGEIYTISYISGVRIYVPLLKANHYRYPKSLFSLNN